MKSYVFAISFSYGKLNADVWWFFIHALQLFPQMLDKFLVTSLRNQKLDQEFKYYHNFSDWNHTSQRGCNRRWGEEISLILGSVVH